jgi:hypothetical protein
MAYWPTYGYFGEPTVGEMIPSVPPTISGNMSYTYQYDVPWDWAHRYPPNVVPSERPYVTTCPEETVTVPGRNGADASVRVMRCY